MIVALWLGFVLVIQGARAILFWRGKHNGRDRRKPDPSLALWLTLTSILAGVCWGATAWLFIDPLQLVLTILTVFVIAGMAAGSSSALPAHPPAFAGFLAAALVPTATFFWFDPRPHTDVMAFLTIAYGIGIGWLGSYTYRTQRDIALLSLTNEDLVNSLREAGHELEERVIDRTQQLQRANEQMAAEIAQRRRSEAKVRYLLHHDPLTNLPNRLVLADRLEAAMRRAERNHSLVALAIFDVDRFKDINDTYGHLTGDALLRALARRLSGIFRASDTVARMGGDEFAAIFPDLASREDAERLAAKLVSQVAEPFSIEGRHIELSLSVGIALFPEHGRDAASLFSGADLALYDAKLHGRGQYRIVTETILHQAISRRRLEDQLKGAAERGEFRLVYQPQFSLRRHRIIGAEALIRWDHPQDGLLLPDAFIPAAETSGAIVEIDNWVIAAACREAVRWQRAHAPVRIAVNLSPLEFRRHDLAAMIEYHLGVSGLAPSLLEIELTEAAFLDSETSRAEEQVDAIKKLGARIAIDDFGTGYASLSFLRWLPFDVVKIDRSFINNVVESRHNRAIVASTVSLANELGKGVIAEGVETLAHQLALQRLGCDIMQGFYFGHPDDEHALRERLAA